MAGAGELVNPNLRLLTALFEPRVTKTRLGGVSPSSIISFMHKKTREATVWRTTAQYALLYLGITEILSITMVILSKPLGMGAIIFIFPYYYGFLAFLTSFITFRSKLKIKHFLAVIILSIPIGMLALEIGVLTFQLILSFPEYEYRSAILWILSDKTSELYLLFLPLLWATVGALCATLLGWVRKKFRAFTHPINNSQSDL